MAGSSLQRVTEESSDQSRRAEELRARLARSRTRSSRPVGISMLVLSGAFFLLAFATGSLLAEASSLTAFVLGALLLVSSFEQKVTLYPSVEAVEGPVKSMVSLLKEKGWTGGAHFDFKPDGVWMMLETLDTKEPIVIRPYGHDLFEFYESQIGKFDHRTAEFVKEWLPRILTDASGLVESVSLTQRENEVSTKIVRPFIRPLCVKPFFTQNVCNTLGCPLVNSVGEALASSTGASVSHVTCKYDPTTQTATAVHRISESA